jgi:hypothetical protein
LGYGAPKKLYVYIIAITYSGKYIRL